ncbi:MAG TPA: FeoA family protein [Vicinamibacterales bacterium]|nr:FeoA family protein [Vicinamibacterales bacterium]
MSSSSSASRSERGTRLSHLKAGERGVVVGVLRDDPARAERLGALGVTPGARIRLLQRFPGFVFECDQTEIVVEPAVARAILVEVER